MKKKTGNRLMIYVVLLLVLLQVFPLRCHAEGKEISSPDDACSGVVRVLAVNGDGSCASGSGFGVGTAGQPTNIFVTNWHVVTGESGKPAEKVYILLDDDAAVRNNEGLLVLDGDKMVECEILYLTTGYPDVAILKASRPIDDHVALRLMYAEDAKRGDAVYTLGFPGSADLANGDKYLYAEIKDVASANGTISKFMEFEIGGSTMSIQHNAHINHGNSGGPLVTEDGNVIGINTYGFGEANTMEYSVSIFVDYAMVGLDELGIAYDVYDPYAGTTGNTGTDTGSETDTGTGTEPNGGTVGESVPTINDGGGDVQFPIIPVAAAAAVVIVVIAAVVLVKGKKKDRAAAPPQSQGQSAFGESIAPTAPAAQQSPVPSVSPAPVSPPVRQAPSMGQPADSGMRLQGTDGAFSGRRFPINGTIRIGRDPARNDLVYPAGTKGISGAHCEIHFREGKVFVSDVGSTYGTFLRGTKIPANQMVPVNIGESVCLGNPQESFMITRSTKTNH